MRVFIWQVRRDSNPDKQNQNLLCYHYTTDLSNDEGQTVLKVPVRSSKSLVLKEKCCPNLSLQGLSALTFAAQSSKTIVSMAVDPLQPVASQAKFKRIVLKLSGEALGNPETNETFSGEVLQRIALEVKKVHELGVEIGLVVGGGNIFRGKIGAESRNVDRTTGDFMGMLSTMINGLALMDCLEKHGVPVRVQSALPLEEVAEPFILRRAIRHLEKGRVVIFVAGTGNPYFSTDTTAALRASEIGADVIMKATKVDGIYDKDPMKFPDAKKIEELTFIDALKNRYAIMDSTAFSLCMDNNMPILVFNMNEHDSVLRATLGEKIGTLVK